MKNLTRQSTDYSHEKHDHVSSQFLENEEEVTQLQDSHLREETERQLAYWKQQLDGTSPVLQLPTDRPRQAVQNFQAAHYAFQLPEALTEAVKALSQQEGVTLFMTMLAAFQILLYRYTGQGDLLVGAVDLGHARAGDAYSRSSSVNTLVLRTSIDGHSPFQEVLRHVQTVVVEGHAHQDMALEQVIENLQLEGGLSHQSLYQVLFVLEAALVGAVEAQDAHSMKDAANYGVARVDLALFVQDSVREIRGEIEYNSDLFKPETIERMAGHWQKLLEGIVADSNQPIDALTLLTDAEWQEQVVEWNATQTAYPQNQCLHELFEEQVERTPEAVAIAFEQEELTYHELNQRANRLARSLHELGVGPESIVALLAERSIAFVTAMLAVWKAGGAYLPLDPHHPAARLRGILEHSGSRFVLAAIGLAPLLAEALRERQSPADPRVVYLEDLTYYEGPPTSNGLVRTTPHNLAYVIYTSGSTGVPKGVMIEHRGMLNHLYAKIGALELTAADCVAQTASQCFDISVWQFLAVLLVGGRVHIFPDIVAHDPMQLLEQVDQHGISVLETVPSLLRSLLEVYEVDKVNKPRLEKLRWLIPTGEALSVDLCHHWLRLYLQVPMLNAYGPTECSDDVTHHPIYQLPAETESSIPIGRALANTQLYVLDRMLVPVPIGVSGELYVGGIGVGRGYLNDPQRTGEAFMPDPFSTEPGARLYKTGDLVRYLPDGTLVFLGRIDHQVKIRGNRIELGEIEAVLTGHPEVKENVVVVRENERGDKQLIAYIVRNVLTPPTDLQAQGNELDTTTAEQWGAIFDEVYSQERTSQQDEKINLRVWVSSYTKQPFPEVEIFESVDNSVERILSLQPKRVLEIGCGTGLLLFRVAPHATYYCGTDIAQKALETLRQRVKAHGQELPEVMLLHCAADDFASIPKEAFDVVIINEVVQYLPSIYYLLRTLEGALSRVQPGGYIFVGGIRNLRLLEAFHLAVQLHQTSPSSTVAELRQRVLLHTAQEKELLIDPDFFFALKQYFPRISDVQIQLKGGKHLNEFTQFRYDAIIRVGAEEPAVTEYPCLSWQEQEVNLTGLQRLVRETNPEVLSLKQIPNERVLSEIKVLEMLTNFGQMATVDELRKASQDALSDTSSIGTEQLRDLGRSLSYDVDICWPASGAKEYYDAVFIRRGTEARRKNVAFTSAIKNISVRPWSQYANSPVHNISSDDLVAQLRTLLKERLPDYMTPSAFVLLEALPLTPNGKLDRRALPTPELSRGEAKDSYVAPILSQHFQLVQIWEDLLGVHPIGIKDDFFDLGGHSLLTVRLFERIAQVFGKKLPLSTLFAGATIEHLATALMGEAKADSWPPLLTVQAGGSRRPFFYLHGQWEEELSFHCYPLARALGSDQPFYALRPYPLDGRKGLPTMEEIAAIHIEAIRSVQPEGPYLLGGWCNGGLVAYEMARQLQAQGQVLDLLVILDPDLLVYPVNYRLYRAAFNQLGKLLRVSQVTELNWYLGLKYLSRSLRYKLLRKKDPDHLTFRDLRQNYPRLFDWIAMGYRPTTLYDGKVTFFWTEAIYEANTEVKGWRKVETGGKIEVHFISGDHMTSRTEYLPVLAEQLDICVRKAQGTAPEWDGQKESS